MTSLKTSASARRQLSVDMSTAHRQALEGSCGLGIQGTASSSTGGLHSGMDLSDEPSVPDAVMLTRDRGPCASCGSAASQGQSGILSLIPPIVGPDSVIAGGPVPALEGATSRRTVPPLELSYKPVPGESQRGQVNQDTRPS